MTWASHALAWPLAQGGVAAIKIVLGGWVDTESQRTRIYATINPTELDPPKAGEKNRARKKCFKAEARMAAAPERRN
jgi:hypothetical protein